MDSTYSFFSRVRQNDTMQIQETEIKGTIMTVEEIVKEYLEKNGYDGLCDDDGCYCEIHNLFLCGEGKQSNCKPLILHLVTSSAASRPSSSATHDPYGKERG